jgi:hypothetical protein
VVQETHDTGGIRPARSAILFARGSGSKSMTDTGANHARFRSCWSASWRIGNSLHRRMQRIDRSTAGHTAIARTGD